MAENLSKHKQLLIAAISLALATGGCLFTSQPKIKVQKEKVAKNKPAQAQPAKTQPSDTQPAKTDAKNTQPTKAVADETADSAEPDKVLYDRAALDIKKGRYTESRLSLQTLINTYPDSEYLLKAKLAVADSFYKEGGTSNFTQAIDEYKNFIVFFPNADEAAYAQMQVGMAHYRMMEKADRDNTNAEAAEDDLQTFLLKYSTSPLAPQAEQRLRDVQEVLADGEYKIARFYFVKQDFPASAARLVEMVDRYPLYSQSDEALWMLGNVYDRAKQISKNEDMKNHFADLAAKCYNRIVEDYPLSSHVPESKSRLAAMGMSVPATDPNALARMQQQQMYEKTHRQNVVMKFPMGMFHGGPDVSAAAHIGPPNLNPPTDAVSATEILKPSSEGPTFSMGAPPAADTNTGADAPPIEATSAGKQDAPMTGTTVQVIDDTAPTPVTPAAPSPAPPATTTPQPDSAHPPAASSATGTTSGNDVPLLAPSTASGAAEKPASSSPAVDPSPAPSTAPATPPVPTNGTQPAAASQNGTQPPAAAQAATAKTDKAGADSSSAADKTDTKKESTSKKKKGLKKLLPW
jgi:outer membrane protein assembly factor BamD